MPKIKGTKSEMVRKALSGRWKTDVQLKEETGLDMQGLRTRLALEIQRGNAIRERIIRYRKVKK